MAKAPVEIRSLARSHTAEAMETLVKIMRDSDVVANARVAAANSLLDRGWGKPEQKLEAEHVHRYVARLPMKASTTEIWQQHHSPPNLQ